MKPKFIRLYHNIAQQVAELSSARRLQVGAIIVKNDRIISIGYNGMPAGWNNNCEDREYMNGGAGDSPEEIESNWPLEDTDGRYRLRTKPEVLHAETNAIAKLAKSNDSGDGADLFVTHSPCLDCAKLIYQSGINRVYFGTHYRDDHGIRFLKQSNIEVIQTGE